MCFSITKFKTQSSNYVFRCRQSNVRVFKVRKVASLSCDWWISMHFGPLVVFAVMIDGSEKRNGVLSFELKMSPVIDKRSKTCYN